MILKLTRDLGVNLAGVEIILNMREKMAEMQRQIEEFVSSLNEQFAAQPRPTGRQRISALIPVINLPPTSRPKAQREK